MFLFYHRNGPGSVCVWLSPPEYSKNCLAFYFTKWNLYYLKHDFISYPQCCWCQTRKSRIQISIFCKTPKSLKNLNKLQKNLETISKKSQKLRKNPEKVSKKLPKTKKFRKVERKSWKNPEQTRKIAKPSQKFKKNPENSEKIPVKSRKIVKIQKTWQY